MKTRKFSLAQILTFVLAFVLTFAMAVPAFAMESPDDSDMTIKILPGEGANTKYGNRFQAYAIFVGTLVDPDETNPIDPSKPVALYNLKWGPEFEEKALEFINFLKDDENNTAGTMDLKKKFADINPTTPEQAKSSNVADNVAKILEANKDDPDFVITFAKVVNKFIEKYKTDITGKTSTWNAENKRWDIDVDSAGYYLILDRYQKIKGDTDLDEVTGFILAVLGDQFVNMKSKTPTVEKDITNGSYDGNTKGDTVNIGDTVSFKLTGTLSENYDQFDTYKYIFHDTLSKGLSYLNGTLKAYAVNKGSDPVEIPYLDATNYTVVSGTGTEEGTTSLTVTFPDLKKLKKDAEGSSIDITEYSEIIITYDAKVNDNAVIGSTGNPNTVQLEFSNDPFSDGTGFTTEKKVYVFSFGLDITKYGDDVVDADGKPTNVLKDAKFVLSRTTTDGTEYATFAPASTDEKGNIIPQKLTGWVKDQDSATTLTTDENGKFIVSGLDAGTYTLIETQPPAGYNLLKPLTIVISAELNADGSLKSVSKTVDGKMETYSSDSEEAGRSIFSSGLIPVDPVNNKAPVLPGTGGIGLVIFYVLGGLLLVGAATYIIVSGRKKSKQQQQ